MAALAASPPASSVKSSNRVPVDQPEPLAAWASTMEATNAVASVDSSVCTRGIALGLVERALDAGRREIARLAAEAEAPAAGRVEDDLQSEPVRLHGLRLLDAVAGQVRGVVEAREQRSVGGDERLDLAHVGLGTRPGQRLLGRARGGGGPWCRGRAPPSARPP